jgi:hypothetical protein
MKRVTKLLVSFLIFYTIFRFVKFIFDYLEEINFYPEQDNEMEIIEMEPGVGNFQFI